MKEVQKYLNIQINDMEKSAGKQSNLLSKPNFLKFTLSFFRMALFHPPTFAYSQSAIILAAAG